MNFNVLYFDLEHAGCACPEMTSDVLSIMAECEIRKIHVKSAKIVGADQFLDVGGGRENRCFWFSARANSWMSGAGETSGVLGFRHGPTLGRRGAGEKMDVLGFPPKIL